MKILITGASGSMGYYLAEYIRKLGQDHYVVGLGRRRDVDVTWLNRYYACDLTHHQVELTKMITKNQFDLIFHLAGVANVRMSFTDPAYFLDNNVGGTLALLQAIQESRRFTGASPRLVHCSSSEVYGTVKEQKPIDENCPVACTATSPYAATKIMQETLINTYQKILDFELVTTRAFGYINPRRYDLVATSFARQLCNGSSVINHGDLTPIRSFADARDIARAYWLAGTLCEPGVYNIGSPFPCSIGELATMVKELSKVDAEWVQADTLARPTDIHWAVPDTTKFVSATGWCPEYLLKDSLQWLLGEVRGSCLGY